MTLKINPHRVVPAQTELISFKNPPPVIVGVMKILKPHSPRVKLKKKNSATVLTSDIAKRIPVKFLNKDIMNKLKISISQYCKIKLAAIKQGPNNDH